jgi:hypothetical protein
VIRPLILAAAMLASTPAYAATKADAMHWELGYQALNILDTAETIDCLNRGICDEANPLFGRHPSSAKLIIAKALFGALHFVIVDRLANHNPRTALRVAQISMFAQGTIVGLNARFTFGGR